MSDIEILETVLDEPVCGFLLANARRALAEGHEFTRSNLQWDENIRQSSALVMVRDYDQILSDLIIDQLLARGTIGHRDYHVMNYAWTPLSFIPWHNDGQRAEAITIYLNNVWDSAWGGLFLFRDPNDAVQSVLPKFNRGVKNRAHVLHSMTPVSSDAPEPRLTIQLFSTRLS